MIPTLEEIILGLIAGTVTKDDAWKWIHAHFAEPIAKPLITKLREAIARGWCSPENERKQMDPDLAEAIAVQVYAAVACLPCDDCEAAGWLIEAHRAGTEYWTGNGWSYGHQDAVRFQRRTDAERVMRDCVETMSGLRVAQHVWVDAVSESREISPALAKVQP